MPGETSGSAGCAAGVACPSLRRDENISPAPVELVGEAVWSAASASLEDVKPRAADLFRVDRMGVGGGFSTPYRPAFLSEIGPTFDPMNHLRQNSINPSTDVAVASPPFFIVGSGRSGSTLLRMMLAAHSRIAIPPETWFILPLLERFSVDQSLNAQELNEAIEIMTSHYRWSDMKITAEELRRKTDRLSKPCLRDLIEVVYDAYLEASGKARWGDKTPPYIRILPQLAALFPGAKFICLVRDGRDVARSLQSLGMYGPWLHENTIEWRDASYWQRKWLKSGYAECIRQVRYEDLVTDTENSLRGICQFLGEEFEPGMLSWQDEVGRLVPTREMHVHQKLKRDSRREDVERWRTEMSAREIFVAEAFMFSHLDRYGYARRFASPAWIPLFWMTRVYCVLLWPSIPFRALRRISRMARQAWTSDCRVVKRIKEPGRGRKAKSSGQVPRAVGWQPRSWRGFFR